MDHPHRNPWAIAGQVVTALVTTAAAICSVVLALLVLESRLGPVSNDPHGYTLVFGSLFLVPTPIVGALALPFVAPRRRRPARMVAAVTSVVWVVAALLLAGFALAGGCASSVTERCRCSPLDCAHDRHGDEAGDAAGGGGFEASAAGGLAPQPA